MTGRLPSLSAVPPHPIDAAGYRRAILFLAFSAVLTGASGLIDESTLATSAIGHALSGPIDNLWLATYVIGGSLVAGGVLTRRPLFEVIGLWLMVAAVVTNAGAILVVRGTIGGLLTAGPVCFAAWVLMGRIGDIHEAARFERRLPGRPNGLPARRRSTDS